MPEISVDSWQEKKEKERIFKWMAWGQAEKKKKKRKKNMEDNEKEGKKERLKETGGQKTY